MLLTCPPGSVSVAAAAAFTQLGFLIRTGKPYGVCYSADPNTRIAGLFRAGADRCGEECSAVEVLLGGQGSSGPHVPGFVFKVRGWLRAPLEGPGKREGPCHHSYDKALLLTVFEKRDWAKLCLSVSAPSREEKTFWVAHFLPCIQSRTPHSGGVSLAYLTQSRKSLMAMPRGLSSR